jgi:hypothetical protein
MTACNGFRGRVPRRGGGGLAPGRVLLGRPHQRQNAPIPDGAGNHFCFGRSSESGCRIRTIHGRGSGFPWRTRSDDQGRRPCRRQGQMLRFRTAPEITSVLGGRPKADAETVASGRDGSDFPWRSFSDDSELAAVRRGWRFGGARPGRGSRRGRLAPSPTPPGRAPSGRCRARSRRARRRGTRGQAR